MLVGNSSVCRALKDFFLSCIIMRGKSSQLEVILRNVTSESICTFLVIIIRSLAHSFLLCLLFCFLTTNTILWLWVWRQRLGDWRSVPFFIRILWFIKTYYFNQIYNSCVCSWTEKVNILKNCSIESLSTHFFL